MRSKAAKVALCGVVSALSVVLMLMTGIVPIATIALPALAGCLTIAIVAETNVRYGFAVYCVVSVLAILLTPDREAILFYILFFGYYPTLYGLLMRIKRKPLRVLAKFGVFNLAMALETALGGAMQNLVVADENAAKQWIRHLAKNRAGRATFLPLTSVRGRTLTESGLERHEGFIDLACNLVQYDPQYTEIVRFLLGRIAVAEDLDTATALARAYQYRFRIVTLDGQIINAGGSFTGGSAQRWRVGKARQPKNWKKQSSSPGSSNSRWRRCRTSAGVQNRRALLPMHRWKSSIMCSSRRRNVWKRHSSSTAPVSSA